jgi:phospholipid/cholesterol/gamma-HCH transport system ATP-binding protein
MVSHEIPEIFGISDWVAMLKNGRIVEMAPSSEFLKTTDKDIREFIFVAGAFTAKDLPAPPPS